MIPRGEVGGNALGYHFVHQVTARGWILFGVPIVCPPIRTYQQSVGVSCCAGAWLLYEWNHAGRGDGNRDAHWGSLVEASRKVDVRVAGCFIEGMDEGREMPGQCGNGPGRIVATTLRAEERRRDHCAGVASFRSVMGAPDRACEIAWTNQWFGPTTDVSAL